MYVIGTAGHVDHGKSTLITALTGINPDRLAEEQERQMTIDLGFSWYTLPSGEEIGIVDVPGHRDFIENMLAGVGGVDAILFVVAADEGIMPQSREHLNIIRLLGIEKGLIVVTKTDLVQDAEWLDLVETDIRDLVKGSFLENAPMIKVSAVKKEGLDVLSEAIDRLLQGVSRIKIGSAPRLPVDRVFSLKGFGTIITGTLIGGSFSVGDQVILLPAGIETRIRGLQTHKKKQETANPGNRTAINLVGVEVKDIQRGDVLCFPHTITPTNMLDVEVEMLPDYPESIKHDDQVKVFLGTAQHLARARVLGGNEIKTGQSGYAQLMLAGQAVAQEGDRLILRRPSPPATIGGGVVIHASPQQRHKRFVPEVIERLVIHASGSISDRVLMAISDLKIADLPAIIDRVNGSEKEIAQILADLKKESQIITWRDAVDPNKQWYLTSITRESIKKIIVERIEDFHHSNPLKRGVDNNLIQTALDLERRPAQAVVRALVNEHILEVDATWLKLPDFSVTLTRDQQKKVDKLISSFEASECQPPSVKEASEQVGEEVFCYLVDSGSLIMVSSTVVFLPRKIEEIITETESLLGNGHKITVADFRDHFNTSRKYAVALLEYMDEQKITSREGDFRKKYERKKYDS